MKKILIISNTACSQTESNGRIHSLHYLKYIDSGNVSNFYLNGIPDNEQINYIHVSNKEVVKSKFGKNISLTIFKGKTLENSTSKKTKKSSYPFFHLIRNVFYSNNKNLIKLLEKYIVCNNIDAIVLWGSNVPFLYEYASKLSKICKKELIIFSGEDYPLKKYNYISKAPSLFFRLFQKRLNKRAKEAYQLSSKNIFATTDLLEAYSLDYLLSNCSVINFSSLIQKKEKVCSSISKIVYAGNLYKDRVKSLIEFASYIKKYKNVKIDLYGNISSKLQKKLEKIKNINYLGTVSYNDLLKKLSEADLLLHVEGFSSYYKKDCKFAFSTKISDYFMLNIPFFIYGPKEISGVKFALGLNEKFVSTSYDELSKIDDILAGKIEYQVDYNKIAEKFSAEENSQKMFSLIEQ